MGYLIPLPGPSTPASVPPGSQSGQSRRVALLVGGHSLKDHWTEAKAAEYDVVVAVNGAVFTFSCDYAIMVDRPLVEKLTKHPRWTPRRALVTYADAYRKRFKHDRLFARFKLLQIPTLGKGHKSYSMPRAIMFCLPMCGPGGSLDVFGMDFSDGRRDVAGLPGDHGPHRWIQEAECLRKVWDVQRIRNVFGLCKADRLAFIRGEVAVWPG